MNPLEQQLAPDKARSCYSLSSSVLGYSAAEVVVSDQPGQLYYQNAELASSLQASW